MEAMPSQARLAFLADLRAAEKAVQSSVSAGYGQAQDKTWTGWQMYCRELALDPLLRQAQDPIQLLQVYAERVRDGRYSRSGKSVRSSTVTSSIRHIGQTIALMGAPDPRLTSGGQLDIRLRRQFLFYTKEDPPPSCVQPIPLPIILHVVHTISQDPLS